MTRTEDLYESARLTELHNRTKIVTVLAKDMMQLIELVWLQHEALKYRSDLVSREASIAFNKFEQGGE